MALTRARLLYGSDGARAQLDAIVHDVLTAPRDPGKLRADVLEMRDTMAGHKPAKGPLDAKLARGGLVDLEFLVHYLQLREGTALVPQLGEAVRALVTQGLLPPELIEAHDAMTRLLVAARMFAPDSQVPPPSACTVLAKACGFGDWEEVLPNLSTHRVAVAAAWADTFGEKLEVIE
jgi:glutamate-ammonia-ligase adenylyltransferase